MAIPLDDVLKVIARSGGKSSKIAQAALNPAGVAAPFTDPRMGKLAGRGLLEGFKPPQVAQHERREGPGGAFGAALTAIDFGRGIMTSTIKESIDLMQGEGFDPGEWWNQATTQYGFGELIHDERNWVGGMMMATSPFTGGFGLALGAGVLANNIWADRVIGFIGDVAVDPLTYMGGIGVFARGAGYMGAIGQLDDLARVAKSAGKLTAGKTQALNAAKVAAGEKKSLSAALRSLQQSGDVGKGLINDLGWTPGMKLRVPLTGPGGRMLRKMGGSGDRVWDVASRLGGKPSGITARRVKQIPDYYDDLFDKRTLTEMTEAFSKGRKAVFEATTKFEAEFAKKYGAAEALENITTLSRVAGQAAKAPLEYAIKGLPSGGKLAAAGLGGRAISQIADLPIRGMQQIPQSVRDKAGVLFDPVGKDLRLMLRSGDPVEISRAVGIVDGKRFAAGKAKAAERGINAANQNLLNWVRRKGTSDTSMTALVRAIRGVDEATGRKFAVRNEVQGSRNFGEITDIDPTTNWFKNLPADLQKLNQTNRPRLVQMAREADQQLEEVQRHVFTAYGDDFGDDVLRKEGAVYSGHRQVNRDFLKAVLGKDEKVPELQGKRGYPVRGRPVPGSVEERQYFAGGPLKIENPDLLPATAEGRLGYVAGVNKDGSALLTADGKPIMVLADAGGNPFKFVNPNRAGMSFDAQVNRVTQQTFGKNLYDDRFSMLAHLQMRNVETDIKMYTLMRKLEADRIMAVAGPEELRLLRDIVAGQGSWGETVDATRVATAARVKVEDDIGVMRSNEAIAAGHVANREADAARLTAKGVAASEEILSIDVQLNDARVVLGAMLEELELLGSSSDDVRGLQAATRKLIERTDDIGKQKKIRGKMLSKYDSITEELVMHGKQLDDLKQLVDEIDELRPQLDAVYSADLAPLARREGTVENARAGGVFYHGRRGTSDKPIRRGAPAERMKPRPGMHVGSKGAAQDRIGVSPPDEDPFSYRPELPIFSVEVTPRNPYMPEGRLLAEAQGGGPVGRADMQWILNDPARQAELLAEGYDVVPYVNAIEDAGSLSYLILDPASVKVRPTPEWSVRDPSVPDGGREVTRGMGGLEPTEARLAAGAEDAAMVEGRYTEALAVHTAAEETVEAAEAAYKANVYKALGARPAAERTAAVAKELEAKAARTAVPDVGADPAVWSARLELEDAEAGLRVAAEQRRALRERLAALEAQPGYKADNSVEALATEPLQHGNNAANKSVLTPGGAVKREAYQARLDQLVKDVADEMKALDEAVKAANRNAPKPKPVKETPAQKAAATKKRNDAEIREQAFRDMGEFEAARQADDVLDEAFPDEGGVLTDFLDEGAAAVPAAKPKGAPVRTMPAETANKIKALREQITELTAEERVLNARLQPDPFPMARRGAVHRELEEAKAALEEAKTNKLRGQNLRRQQLANAEEQLAAAPKGHNAAAREARAVAQDRVDAAQLAKDDPKHNDVFNAAKASVEAASKAVDELPETAPNTVKQLKGQRTRKRNQIKALRDEATSLKMKDDDLTRKALIEAGDYYAPDHRWRAADTKKVTSKRRRLAKANGELRAESDVENPSSLAGKVKQAEEVVDLRRKRDEAKKTLEVFEKKMTVVRNTDLVSGRVGDPQGRLEAARTRVRGGTKAVADAEALAEKDGGPVRIVGKSDPRVRNPRLYAQGPNGQGLVKIPRPKDVFGDDFALLRVVRKGDGWELTSIEQDLTKAAGGRQNALIRTARRTSPKRDELRQQGWRFFDEDVAEGSTRVSGEAAEARRAATDAARPLREATEGAAEAQRVGDTTVVPPEPDAPATTYATRAELTEAFDIQVRVIKGQITEVEGALEAVRRSLLKFAADDVTSQAMEEIKTLLEAMKRGVAGTEGLTASARVNRWMRNLSELDRLQKAVDYERTLGVEALPDLKTRITMFNDRIAEIAEELKVETNLQDVGWGFEGQVPRLSSAQLDGLQAQFTMVADLQATAVARLADAERFKVMAAEQLRIKGVQGSREAKNQVDILALETGALIRAVEEETAIFGEQMAALRGRKIMKKRIDETVKRLDRDGEFTLGTTNKDVMREARDVTKLREEQGITDRTPWMEDGGVANRSLRDILDLANSVEADGGYKATSVKGKLFHLNQKERKLAQEYLKSALSGNEWGPWTLSKGDPFREQTHKVIQAFGNVNDPTAWDGSTGLWKMWDNFQTYLKASMIATPGFVARNIFGAFFNAWLDDVNPAEMMRSLQMTMTVAKRAQRDGVGFYSAAKALAKTNTKYRQYVELLDVGVRGGGQAVHSVELEIGLRNAMDVTLLVGGKGRNPATQVSLAPWSPRFAPYQGIRSVNSWVEDIVRLGVGMDTMRWGGSVDDALKRIAKSQFDYDELTQFERTWMRRFFPFYTWTRKNVPYQLEQLGRNPAKYNKILAGKRNLELGTQDEDIVPDYFLEPFGVRMPFKYKGAQVYSAPDFPFQDLARYDPFDSSGGGLKKVAQGVASMMTPILKAPLETAFGKQMYNGVPFTGRFQLAPAAISKFPGMGQALRANGWLKKGPSGEWKMRDHHIYLITNMLPSLGFLRRIAPNEPKYQRAYLRTLMSTLGGVSASFNTDAAKNNWLTNLRYERQEDRQAWKDMTSQTR